MLSSGLHGVFVGTAVALVTFGVAKSLTRPASQSTARRERRSFIERAVTIHENAPRLIGITEAAVGVAALVFAWSDGQRPRSPWWAQHSRLCWRYGYGSCPRAGAAAFVLQGKMRTCRFRRCAARRRC